MPPAGCAIHINYRPHLKKTTVHVFSHTHRAIQFSLTIHGEVQTTVYASDTNQSHSQTNELQNTCTKNIQYIHVTNTLKLKKNNKKNSNTIAALFKIFSLSKCNLNLGIKI